jgi:hypothetical protein
MPALTNLDADFSVGCGLPVIAHSSLATSLCRWSSVFTTPTFRFRTVLTGDGSQEVELVKASKVL